MNVTTEQLFTEAHTQYGYLDAPVHNDTLRQLYDLMKWGPTSANCTPARILFVRASDAKAKLMTCMNPGGNVEKVRQAPVTAVIGMDMEFYERLPQLFPHTDARSWFAGNDEAIRTTALRNSSLQGGYFIIAARALGLDCGPMSGFDAAKMNDIFWPGTTVKTNFVCTLGKGDPSKIRPRGPRMNFDEVCRIV